MFFITMIPYLDSLMKFGNRILNYNIFTLRLKVEKLVQC